MNAILAGKDFSVQVLVTILNPSPTVTKIEILLLGVDAPAPFGARHLLDFWTPVTGGWLRLYMCLEMAVIVDSPATSVPVALVHTGVPDELQPRRS